MSSLLRNRGFLLLWSGQSAGMLADWSARTVLLVWAYSLTHSAGTASVIGLAEVVPLLLLAPLAGVLVDRVSRAGLMGCTAVARCLVLAPLLLPFGDPSVVVVATGALLVSACAVLFAGAASAALPAVAAGEELGQANSLLSLGNGLIFGLGPALSAGLFALTGPRPTLALLVALYILAAPLLFAVPAPAPPRDQPTAPRFLTEMLDGLNYLRRSPLLSALALVLFISMLSLGALSVLDVVFVTRALGRPPGSVSVLLFANGSGETLAGIAMTILAARLATRYHLLIGGAVFLEGLAFAGYAVAPTLPVAAAILFLVGLTYAPLTIALLTLIQLGSEDAVLGRVMSLINAAIALALVLSLTFAGALTDLLGVRQVIALAAIPSLCAGVLSLVLIRSTPQTTERGPSAQILH